MAEDLPPDDPQRQSRRGRTAGRGRMFWSRFRESGAAKWVGIGAGILLVLAIVGWYSCGFQGCPDPEALTAWEPGGAPIVLDRNGEEFATLLPVQRELVDIDSLPDHVGQAFIAVEDRRFRSHGGVDVRRVLGALVANIRAGGVAEGGSTITMQLARNAFPEQLPASQRNLRRKIAEARVAMEIEDDFDKEQILGLYLNQIYFGNGAWGIAAASRQYFDLPVSELRPDQSALLAAMVKAPAHYDPRDDPEEALERRDLVLDLMLEEGFLSEEEHREAKDREIEVASRRRDDGSGSLPAYWYLEAVRRALEEELGADLHRTQLRVHSTLDPALQEAAEDALLAQLSSVESGRYGAYQGAPYDPGQPPGASGSGYLQGAVVVLSPRNGEVLALVGGRDHRHSSFDHALDADRQVGSAFKPFVYGAAVARGIPPSHVLVDEPYSIEIRGSPTYEPSNYDGRFEGPLSAREALARSRNVPTVRLAQEVGTGAVADFARDAGIEGDIPEGPSMALGTIALSPMELARAYAAFAGRGRAAGPRFIRRVETEEGRVLWEARSEAENRIEPRVAYILNDMLKDVIDGGTGSAARSAGFRGPGAGKTGTTQESADVWFAGYTPDLIGVVWMGFDQPAPILPNATGGALAAPVWGRMMARAGRSGSEWEMPDGVVRLPYDPLTGQAIARDCPMAAGAPTELFLRGETGGTSCPDRAPDRPGMDTFGIDSLGIDSLRIDAPGRDSLGGDTLPADTTMGDTIRPDTIGGDTVQDTVRTDTTGVDTSGADTASVDTTRTDRAGAPSSRRPITRSPPTVGAGPAARRPGARPGR